jgi:hypothetical protein
MNNGCVGEETTLQVAPKGQTDTSGTLVNLSGKRTLMRSPLEREFPPKVQVEFISANLSGSRQSLLANVFVC